MLYLIYGEDDFSCREAVKSIVQEAAGDPSLRDLNRSNLDGSRVTLEELKHHCNSIPFLAERRLVIVEGLITRLDGKGGLRGREGPEGERKTAGTADLIRDLLSYLSNLPETTDLVLFDPGLGSKTSRGRIINWARAEGDKAQIIEHKKKDAYQMRSWIKARAETAGAAIEERAAAELAWTFGDNLAALAQEIEKLALFSEPGQVIAQKDIRRLTSHSRESNIFNIVDAISERRWSRAIAELRLILEEGAHPLYILTMIHRQFSLIVQAKALAGERLQPAQLARRLGIHEYPAKKVQQQSSRYTDKQLRHIYDRLVDTDLAIKTGKLDPALALELFIADLDRLD